MSSTLYRPDTSRETWPGFRADAAPVAPLTQREAVVRERTPYVVLAAVALLLFVAAAFAALTTADSALAAFSAPRVRPSLGGLSLALHADRGDSTNQ